MRQETIFQMHKNDRNIDQRIRRKIPTENKTIRNYHQYKNRQLSHQNDGIYDLLSGVLPTP